MPTDDQILQHFAREYSKRPRILYHTGPTPSARTVREVIEKFESDGVAFSPSGMTAEIIAQWCVRNGQSYQLLRQATLKVWVITRITDKEVEAIATGTKPDC